MPTEFTRVLRVPFFAFDEINGLGNTGSVMVDQAATNNSGGAKPLGQMYFGDIDANYFGRRAGGYAADGPVMHEGSGYTTHAIAVTFNNVAGRDGGGTPDKFQVIVSGKKSTGNRWEFDWQSINNELKIVKYANNTYAGNVSAGVVSLAGVNEVVFVGYAMISGNNMWYSGYLASTSDPGTPIGVVSTLAQVDSEGYNFSTNDGVGFACEGAARLAYVRDVRTFGGADRSAMVAGPTWWDFDESTNTQIVVKGLRPPWLNQTETYTATWYRFAPDQFATAVSSPTSGTVISGTTIGRMVDTTCPTEVAIYVRRVVGSVSGTSYSPPVIGWKLKSAVTPIVQMGTSITVVDIGQTARVRNTITIERMLREKLRRPIVILNYAVGGSTIVQWSNSAHANFTNAVAAINSSGAKIVMFEAGSNDPTLTQLQFTAYLQTFIANVFAAAPAVTKIFLTPPPQHTFTGANASDLAATRSFQEAMKTVVNNRTVFLVGADYTDRSSVDSPAQISTDGTHLNTFGNHVRAEAVATETAAKIDPVAVGVVSTGGLISFG